MNQPGSTGAGIDLHQSRDTELRKCDHIGQLREAELRYAITALFLPERFQGSEFIALRDQALSGLWSVDTTRDQLLDLVGRGGAGPIGGGAPTQSDSRAPHGGGVVIAGDDAIDKYMRGVELAILGRANMLSDDTQITEARSGGFMAVTVS